MGPIVQDLQKEIDYILASAQKMRGRSIEINSGYLHQRVGRHLSSYNKMSACCNVMKKTMQTGDKILRETPNEDDAFLVIHYQLPREFQ